MDSSVRVVVRMCTLTVMYCTYLGHNLYVCLYRRVFSIYVHTVVCDVCGYFYWLLVRHVHAATVLIVGSCVFLMYSNTIITLSFGDAPFIVIYIHVHERNWSLKILNNAIN